MKKVTKRPPPLMLPVVSLGAEHLVMGHLLRRNILTYKAPAQNEGYDLICMHPDPRKAREVVRVQVKSRYQTDCDRAFPVKDRSFDAFDFLVVVFLNIGFFYGGESGPLGRHAPEFYTLPARFVRRHHRKVQSGFDRVHTAGLNLLEYKDEAGFEMIAEHLGIKYPCR